MQACKERRPLKINRIVEYIRLAAIQMLPLPIIVKVHSNTLCYYVSRARIHWPLLHRAVRQKGVTYCAKVVAQLSLKARILSWSLSCPQKSEFEKEEEDISPTTTEILYTR